MKRHVLTVVGVLVLVLGVLQVGRAQAAPSMKVALVPSGEGAEGNGGDLPVSGFLNGFAPTFTDVSLDAIADDATNPLSGFDTVVLVQVCDVGTFLAKPQFRARLESFVSGGGKLLIWDSECEQTDYQGFIYPFTTSNPGAAGANGTLTITENDALGSSDPTSPHFVDAGLVSTDTDAVGDANVFVTKDPHWCVAMEATNVLGVNGPVVNYAPFGAGLIVYTGLDMDELESDTGFDPTASTGDQHLARLWQNQLLVDGLGNLPCGVLAFGMTLTPPTATLAPGAAHTLTASLFDNGKAVPGVAVTFTVTGPNATTGSATTGADGTATFTYTGTTTGTDTVTATATIARTPVERTATVIWQAPATTTSSSTSSTTTSSTTTPRSTTTTTAPLAVAAEAVRAQPAFTG